MPDTTQPFVVRLAETAHDLWAAQRLRYRVFVEELGATGDNIDHTAKLEADRFDTHCDHLLLIDPAAEVSTGAYVIGVYRLLRTDQAAQAGRFYSETEYDLTALKRSGKNMLELGRSCVDHAHRGGAAMYLLWQALAAYVETHTIELLFGVASFHGTDKQSLAHPLSLLHAKHLAPSALRPQVLPENGIGMDMLPAEDIDRRAAMKATPALIKAYLRLGGYVGQGAFVDHSFNTTDVCLVLETEKINKTQRAIYTQDRFS